MDSPGSSNLPKSGLKPKVAEMVNNSIATLNERNGSSLYAIKKQIGKVYPVDVERLAPFIKKYLKKAVLDGTLIQTTGQGASGSFKLSKIDKEKKNKKHVEKVNKPTQKQVAKKSPTPVQTTKSKIKVDVKLKITVVKKVSPGKVTSKGITENKIGAKRITEKKVTPKVFTRKNESPIEKKSTVRAKPVKSLSKSVLAK